MPDIRLLTPDALASLKAHWDAWGGSGCHLGCDEFDEAASALILAAELLPEMATALRRAYDVMRHEIDCSNFLPCQCLVGATKALLTRYRDLTED